MERFTKLELVMEMSLYTIHISYIERLCVARILPGLHSSREFCASCESCYTDLKRLFHENVGSSAWGLAIHSQSRLIAVSSNLKQVSVFAFGVTGSENPNMPYQL